MGQRDTILIVDDMEVNRVILSGLFQEEYHLLEAENGEQALLLLKQYHGNIAIMLLDVVMPVMDGYQVMKEMGAADSWMRCRWWSLRQIIPWKGNCVPLTWAPRTSL